MLTQLKTHVYVKCSHIMLWKHDSGFTRITYKCDMKHLIIKEWTNEREREVCVLNDVTSICHCALRGQVWLDIGRPPLQCVLCVLKMDSLGTWSQGTVLLQPLPCACVYMLRMPYAKWLVLLLRFPLAALPHSRLNEELSESGRNLKQSDIELLVLLIKNFTPMSSHEHLFVLTLWSIENGHH